MKTLHRKPDPAADEQASLWAARLEGGTLSAADRDALDAWLNADLAHRPLLSRYCQFSADLEEQLLALVATGGVKLPPEPDTESVIRVSRWTFARVASITLAAAAALALGVWVSRPGTPIETIATAAAQRSSVALADGTRVELNARTNLTFENGSSERHVRLAGGEAFFTVAKDRSRPFIIETPAGSVRVTGTVFNVRCANPAELEVAVVEGSVEVRARESSDSPYRLGAKDSLSAVHGVVTRQALTTDQLNDALAWRQGQIALDHVPLRDALARFADYHARTIILSAGILAHGKPVGGWHHIDDLDHFLTGIHASQGVLVRYEPNGTIRVSMPGEP